MPALRGTTWGLGVGLKVSYMFLFVLLTIIVIIISTLIVMMMMIIIIVIIVSIVVVIIVIIIVITIIIIIIIITYLRIALNRIYVAFKIIPCKRFEQVLPYMAGLLKFAGGSFAE